MQSPFRSTTAPSEPPRTVERRRRGRNVDLMSAMPTPERAEHLPTPVTQHRTSKQAARGEASVTGHLPTPQTLPRIRAPRASSQEAAEPISPPSPSGHTTFFLASATTSEVAPPRRRAGLMFAQQMGFVTQSQASASTDLKFGGRLGLGVGMGGVMRSSHGPVDKMSLDDNPFIDHGSASASASTSAPSSVHLMSTPTAKRQAPPAPGADTAYVPQILRPSAERSMSPHPRHRRRGAPGQPTNYDDKLLVPDVGVGSSSRRQTNPDEDNPFVAKPGEKVVAHPSSEKGPLVTYVFRGAKKVFANPFVDPETSYAPAELDPKHPDFDVHPAPKPRLLWPTEDSAAAPPPETPQRPRKSFDLMGVSDDDFVPEASSDDDVPARRGLLFGNGAGMKHDREAQSPGVARKRARV